MSFFNSSNSREIDTTHYPDAAPLPTAESINKDLMSQAVKAGDLDAVKKLVIQKVNPQDFMLEAVQNNQVAIASFFKELGVKFTQDDKEDRNCLHIAVLNQNLEMVKLVYETNPETLDVKSYKQDHKTPLFMAVSSGFYEIVEFFLSVGADYTRTDKNSSLMKTVAYANERFDIFDLITAQENADAKKHLQNKKDGAWIMLASDRIAHVVVEQAISQKITERFNFSANERNIYRTVQNLDTKNETTFFNQFDDLHDKKAIDVAFNKLVEAGGGQDCYGAATLQKDRVPSLGKK
jgi:ankyrin repeat protein